MIKIGFTQFDMAGSATDRFFFFLFLPKIIFGQGERYMYVWTDQKQVGY